MYMGERGTFCLLCWRALIFGGELCLVPVGPVGDLDLGVYNVCLSFLLGLVIVFGGCPSLFWVRGTLMVLDAVCCYVCEVLRMS